MHIHLITDLLAWGVGILAGFFAAYLRGRAEHKTPLLPTLYYVVALCGAIVGAFWLGTINLIFTDHEIKIGRSLLGALAGAIIFVEVYKKITGLRGSTGVAFVGAISVGAAIGRVGCHLAGLDDYTYGIKTGLPWGVDYGDGVMRHPVALYEAVSMAVFAIIYFIALWRKASWALNRGFYIFVLVYAGQRFVWEFFKPYGTIIGPFNVFHLVCLGLIAYAVYMLRRQNGQST